MTNSARLLLISLAMISLLGSGAPAAPYPQQQTDSKATQPLTTPPTIRIPRVSRPPKLEDFLNNTPREAETKVTDFRQREPHDGDPISQPTAGYLSYDDKNLYVVIEC